MQHGYLALGPLLVGPPWSPHWAPVELPLGLLGPPFGPLGAPVGPLWLPSGEDDDDDDDDDEMGQMGHHL